MGWWCEVRGEHEFESGVGFEEVGGGRWTKRQWETELRAEKVKVEESGEGG